MPEIGEIKKGGEIKKTGTGQYIWVACPRCSVERWVDYRFYKRGKYRERGMCRSCSQSIRHPEISKGWLDRFGYKHIALRKTDFFYPMTDQKGYVREHRLVVAKVLGRCLHPWETVHHKGAKYPRGSKEDKADNRYPENLELTCEADHHHLRYNGRMLTCPFCKNKIKISLKLFH